MSSAISYILVEMVESPNSIDRKKKKNKKKKKGPLGLSVPKAGSDNPVTMRYSSGRAGLALCFGWQVDPCAFRYG
ncbi:hypothetical protein M513_09838 [Trichuris suis]|uniref:Uncharacterized protein n=1 Tax=Trichuris suis TaxID=68888 RepID=A0A085LWE0_9BILA|nr:hypothetical protein M513_09838 [Trichuris suis]